MINYEKAKQKFITVVGEFEKEVSDLKEKMGKAKDSAEKMVYDTQTKVAKATANRIIVESIGSINEVEKMKQVEREAISEAQLAKNTMECTSDTIRNTVKSKYKETAKALLESKEAEDFVRATFENIQLLEKKEKSLLEQIKQIQSDLISTQRERQSIKMYTGVSHSIKLLADLSGVMPKDESICLDLLTHGISAILKEDSIVFDVSEQIQRSLILNHSNDADV